MREQAKMTILLDHDQDHTLKRSAVDVMEALPVITSETFPHTPNDFYSFKYVSMEAALKEVREPGDWAQFGVYKGALARMMLESLPEDGRLHLFDSFEGLPEDWISSWKAGAFALPDSEIPTFDDPRVAVHKGWFNKTVPDYMGANGEDLAFIHVDCDLYSSTIDCLFGTNDRIKKGTILLFDEYRMAREGETDDGEHRALVEWVASRKRRVEYLWRTKWVQVCVRVQD